MASEIGVGIGQGLARAGLTFSDALERVATMKQRRDRMKYRREQDLQERKRYHEKIARDDTWRRIQAEQMPGVSVGARPEQGTFTGALRNLGKIGDDPVYYSPPEQQGPTITWRGAKLPYATPEKREQAHEIIREGESAIYGQRFAGGYQDGGSETPEQPEGAMAEEDWLEWLDQTYAMTDEDGYIVGNHLQPSERAGLARELHRGEITTEDLPPVPESRQGAGAPDTVPEWATPETHPDAFREKGGFMGSIQRFLPGGATGYERMTGQTTPDTATARRQDPAADRPGALSPGAARDLREARRGNATGRLQGASPEGAGGTTTPDTIQQARELIRQLPESVSDEEKQQILREAGATEAQIRRILEGEA